MTAAPISHVVRLVTGALLAPGRLPDPAIPHMLAGLTAVRQGVLGGAAGVPQH
jgi:hypothetical protein